jgi:predicted DNA-binding transcriptional regulator YafY
MDDDERSSGKQDRLARFYRVLQVLESRGEEGATPAEVARLTGVSKRTVYRDLLVLQNEIKAPIWSENGRDTGFLKPLAFTRSEAMAMVLAARLIVRYADEHDPDLAGAFQKLAGALPPVLSEHVSRSLDTLARRPPDPDYTHHVHILTQAWADRRVVRFTYDSSIHDPGRGPREAIVRPWYLEPSLATHALYLIGWDETRDAVRTFKIERIRDLSLTTQAFEPPEGTIDQAMRNAWDIISDQPEADVVLRFDPSVAARVREATWHPSEQVEQEPDGGLRWRARVAGTIEIRAWILSWGHQVEVVEPGELRDEVAAIHRVAAAQYDQGEPAADAARGVPIR